MYKKLDFQNKCIYLLGIIFFLIASVFSKGYYHFDEHFQILEFAGLKLGFTNASNLPWEYHQQMRPSLQPSLVVVICRFFEIFGVDNPYFITFFLRLLSSGLAFISTILLYKVYIEKISDYFLKRWFIILSFTLWFVIYIGVRFSSENWSGLLFSIGFSCYFLFQKRNFLSYFTIGVLFGLSFLFRYQAAFLILGFSLWLLFINKESFTKITSITLGFIFIVLSGVLIDKWFYGEWTLTTWNYFTQNILEDKASSFGIEPWWWYITNSIEKGVPPISILFILAFFVVTIFKPKSPYIWSIIPFFFIHCIIGHKELRFLFPIYLFIPIIIIQGIEVLQYKYIHNLSSSNYMKGFMKLVLIINTVMILIVIMRPADAQISLYHKLYKSYKEPTILYYIGKNPYHRVLDIYFYKRGNLSVVPITSVDNIPRGTNKLLVLEHKDESNNPRFGKLIFKTYPDWIMKFNFNNWQSRSNSWYIYEIK